MPDSIPYEHHTNTFPNMSFFKSLSISISLVISISLLFSFTHAGTFVIRNNCPYTVWAAASPGGGTQLNSGQTWTINVAAGTTMGRVWARTNCNFDGSGRGHCQTGDCGGRLVCQGYGAAPNTLAEYALNQFAGRDYWDISLDAGFNVPMEFSGCNIDLRCGGPGCPDAYPKQPTCPGNSNYRVVFCP